MVEYVMPFEKLRNTDVGSVGGKNASLGEMISQLTQKEIRVPTGFATTAQAFQEFLKHNNLGVQIESELEHLDTNDVQHLAASGKKIRNWIMQTPFPKELDHAIEQEYETLIKRSSNEMTFAVRSSATAEDLPDASFAGQQESFLNIHGIDNIKKAIKEVFASLYNDRAISYRVHKGFIHADVSISAGVQQMVRSDIGCAGVMFSIDTESGFKDVVFITSSYGLGETVVQGAVNPDEFYVHKPLLKKNFPQPQDKKYAGEPCELRIGDGNTIREFCTFNIGTAGDAGLTQVGDDNWIMAYVHVAHDCLIGNHTIFANNSQLAGHVHVGDWVILGGFTVVHQFVKIGAHAMTAMCSLLFADVPPFVMTQGQPAAARSMNYEGLRRRGFSADAIAAVKAMHKALYREGKTLEESVRSMAQLAEAGPDQANVVQLMTDFLSQVDPKRGIVR